MSRVQHKKRKYASRYRKKQSLFRKRWFWDIVLAAIFLSSFTYLLFFTGVSRIQIMPHFVPEFEISNHQAIRDVLKSMVDKPILLFRPNKMEKDLLASVSEFASVKIDRHWRYRQVSFEYDLRAPELVVCNTVSTSDCWLIDKQANEFAKSEVFSYWQTDGLAKVLADKKLVADEVLRIKNISAKLVNLEIAVKYFALDSQGRLDAYTAGGWQIYFDLSSDLDLALQKLEILLSQEIDSEQQKNLKYIDLRFSKVYYQ